LTEDLGKKYTYFQRGCNQFEVECTICIPRMFLSVANKRYSDIQVYLETTIHTNNVSGESSSSKISFLSNQVRKQMQYMQQRACNHFIV
jgi:hypothetical protein